MQGVCFRTDAIDSQGPMAITFNCGSGSPFALRVWLALEHMKLGYDLRRMAFSDDDPRICNQGYDPSS
jgi:hypothetical protein